MEIKKPKNIMDGFATALLNAKVAQGYNKKKYNGGSNTMNVKSRFEVIKELEEEKRRLINEREGFDDKIKTGERDLRDAKREIEDKIDELNDFKESVTQRKETIKELIKSVDESLERFTKLSTK